MLEEHEIGKKRVSFRRRPGEARGREVHGGKKGERRTSHQRGRRTKKKKKCDTPLETRTASKEKRGKGAQDEWESSGKSRG